MIWMRFNNRKSRSGFTLIEILIVVALTGIIASLAMVPVIVVIRNLTEAEADYTDELALRRTAIFMGQEAAAALRLAPVPVRVITHERMGGGREDVLIFASSAPAKQNLAAGSLVYKIVNKRFMDEEIYPGLYRWHLPGVLPVDVDPEKLNDDKKTLVLPYVTSFAVAVPEGSEWRRDYEGELPKGLKFELARKNPQQEKAEEERIEYVVSFP